MDYCIEHHRVTLEALAPIHIGDGSKIGKKEYIRNGRTVIVPDMLKLLSDISGNPGLMRSFEESMQGDGSVQKWIEKERIPQLKLNSWTKYSLDAGDAFVRVKGKYAKEQLPMQVSTFIKGADGKPYIPGSSIKGMIRTALLIYEMRNNAEFDGIKNDIIRASEDVDRAYRDARENNRKLNPNRSFLREAAEKAEVRAFHSLKRPGQNAADAVNSVMSGLIVGDSEPIPVEQLTWCQKIDYSRNGKENPLNTMREALKPGTRVQLDISFDRTIFRYSVEQIQKALNDMQAYCYDYFYREFGRGEKADGIVWLGGGAGFLSKTIIYQLFSKETAVEITDSIFKNTLGKTRGESNYNIHKHDRDVKDHGISPHMCKCTYCRDPKNGKSRLYDMGKARLIIS